MMTPDQNISGPIRVSIIERLVPAFAFAVAAISGAVGGGMLFRMLNALRQAENAGYAAIFTGVSEIEFVVAGVLIFAAVLCGVGILVCAIRLFTTNTTASPPGLLFLMTGVLSLVPAFALHYILHTIKGVVVSADQTNGGISGIAGTITAVTWFAIGSAILIAIVMLAFSFIPFSSRPGKKSSPLVCLVLAEIFLAILIGIYLWEGRESLVEKNRDRDVPSSSSSDDSDTNTGDSGIPLNDDSTNSNSSGRTISGGILNGKAIDLPQPPYPPAARAVRADGTVMVQVMVDESGKVTSANAVSGHPLLRAAAVSAARQVRFNPTKLAGQPVKVSGVLTYNFEVQ
jgi:TonB family protein